MNRRWSTPPQRDAQEPSPFAAILQRLCEATSARAAALVDVEGETVDYAAAQDPFEIKVAAAEWRLILSFLGQSRLPALVVTHEIFVRAQNRSYYLAALEEGYAIVLELPRHCFSTSRRAVCQAVHELSLEAGLPSPAWCSRDSLWRRVRVRTEQKSRRPTAVCLDREWQGLAVLGRYAEPTFGVNEIGYRVRLNDGNELSLVREPLGYWYLELL